MLKLKEYTSYIEDNLQKIDIPTAPVELYEPIRYFLTIGGKRIRPILTLLAAELFGIDKAKALPQALCIEVFHNFTLIHDDIMDQAPIRRNKATVHKKWDQNTAILSGDVLFIKAYQLLADIEHSKLPEALELFNKTGVAVCEGQQYDMNFESRDDVSIHAYIEMIRLKTSVLLGCALKMGAIIADANDSDKKELYTFGENIGIAFQIQDDILDLYGDSDVFGKQIGGDVISNKKTILHLTALSKATKEQIEISKQLQQENDLELKVRRTRQLFDHLNVKEDCKVRMQEHYKLALSSMGRISTSEESKKPLLELAKYLMDREI